MTLENLTGLTTEEIEKGFEEFIDKKSTKLKSGFSLLDNILKDGIPKDKVTVIHGRSNIGSLYHEYIMQLIKDRK